LEEDPSRTTSVTARRAAARQRQVDIGKARSEYIRYESFVPKERRTPTRPRTPDPSARVSKRQFDRQLSEWRRLLHEYDDPNAPPEEESPAADTAGGHMPASAQATQALPLLPGYRPMLEVPPWGSPYMGLCQSPQASLTSKSRSSTCSGSGSTLTADGSGSRAPALAEALGFQGAYSAHLKPWDGLEANASQPVRRSAADRGAENREDFERGSTLLASCREAAATPPGHLTSNGSSRDPSEPMKVHEVRDPSEPMQVVPSFSGPFSNRWPRIQ